MVHLRDEKKDLAVADLDQALKLKPDHVDALMQRASMRLANHDDAGARADYEAAISAVPSDPALELAIARTYTNAGQYEVAISFLDRWIDTYSNDPRRASALNSRCYARASLNQRLDLAMADCNASLKLRFEPAALDSRALVWLRMGN